MNKKPQIKKSKIIRLKNDDFTTLQTAGILPNLGWITNKTNIELAEQNAEWLTYDYLLRNYLLI